MSADDLRATFEAHMPLPAGVIWIGEHYSGSAGQMGSFRNASEWDAMLRGFLVAAKLLLPRNADLAIEYTPFPNELIFTNTIKYRDPIISPLVECGDTMPGPAKPFVKLRK